MVNVRNGTQRRIFFRELSEKIDGCLVGCLPPTFCMAGISLPLRPPHGPFAPAYPDFLGLGDACDTPSDMEFFRCALVRSPAAHIGLVNLDIENFRQELDNRHPAT